MTQTATAGVRMISLDERNQWQYGAAYYADRQEPTGQPADDSHALYVDVERAWRRVDDLAAPSQGWIALAQVGAGIPGASTRGFERVVLRTALWQPINREWSFTARAEAGAVFAASRTGIPSALLFRTGGDTTVRGYAFESLGIQRGDAILPARYYGVASVEVTRWFSDVWGIAAFVDAGNAFDDWSDFDVAVGYGIRRARENADRPVPSRHRLWRTIEAGAAALLRRCRVLIDDARATQTYGNGVIHGRYGSAASKAVAASRSRSRWRSSRCSRSASRRWSATA